MQGTDGNFYGTTSGGGTSNHGTVFKITAAGKLMTLYSFCTQTYCADGEDPVAGLVQATDGDFYGTTAYGGANNNCVGALDNIGCGTVFRLDVGLGPFVETEPTSGAVGAAIIILGTDLTGTTSVTFNGTAAAFTVVQPSEIETTVPSGATTGPVRVTTPKGMLTSNVNFNVTVGVNEATEPVFTPAGGTYTNLQMVTITDTTPGATIHYTTNDTTPTTSSTKYMGSITVSSTERLEAIAVAPNYSPSAVAIATYGIAAAEPAFSRASGTYTSPQMVTITDATPEATIYYTTDGTLPSRSSPTFSSTSPITVTSTETIRALAVATGYDTSPEGVAIYTIVP